MKTDTVLAYQIEKGDTIVEDEEILYVTEAPEDDGDYIAIPTVDEEGETFTYRRGPFDTMTLVTSLYDEDVDIPDEEIEG